MAATIEYAEPTWGLSQPTKEACSSLVSTGISPYILKGIILQLLKLHFLDCDNIRIPALRSIRWCGDGQDVICENDPNEDCNTDYNCGTGPIVQPDPNDPEAQPITPEPVGGSCGIHIGGSGDLELGKEAPRPAIYVKIEDTRKKRNTALDGSSTPAGKNPVTGKIDGSRHSVTLQGAFSIVCVAVTQTQAEILGEEVYFRMLEFSPIIEKDFGIGLFNCTNLKAAAKLQQAQTTDFYTVVRIEWAHVHNWLLKAEAPILKRLHLRKSVCKQELGD
jgi:hypothetical protein